MNIPEVDFAPNQGHRALEHKAIELAAALSKFDCVFLKNTGITEAKVDRVMKISEKFFLQSEEEKQRFQIGTVANFPGRGWSRHERLNPNRPEDLKESFNLTLTNADIQWPSGAAEGFQEIQTSFYRRCSQLSERVLSAMALGLDLDPQVFLSAHRWIGAEGNKTTLRSLYYPPVDHGQVKEGQLRCGEHSDYGSITLLFSGSEGLQVRSRSGEFVDVPQRPGAVLVNVGDLMQRWTNDRFVSVVHRVVLPPDGDSRARQSLAFFVQPDNHVLIECLGGSPKYPPVTAGVYLHKRSSAAYEAN